MSEEQKTEQKTEQKPVRTKSHLLTNLLIVLVAVGIIYFLLGSIHAVLAILIVGGGLLGSGG